MTFSEKFMWEAIFEARKGYGMGEVPIGAVLTFNGKIISKGHNEVISKNDPTAHAEIVAIRKAAKILNNYRLTGCTLYVTIEPCIMCLGAIVQARIKKVVFGARDERFGAIISLLDFGERQIFNHHFEYECGILEGECRDLIQSFFKLKRK